MKTTFKIYKKASCRTFAAAALLTLIGASGVKAQLNPLAAQYYNNQYLGNPAMAGLDKGFELNAAYRQQSNNMPGAPELQSLTATYGFNKVGLGLNIINDKAGLQRQTRVVGTYAYHLDFENDRRLHFGVSFGFMNQRLENSDINGDPNDVLVGQYNDRKTYLDGDFGAAYTTGRLTVQGSLPNLKTFFKKDNIKVADEATFYGALSYKFAVSKELHGMELEPKVAYRGVRGYDNILDVGAQLNIANDQFSVTGIYHSTESATMGIGLNFQRKYLVSGMYTTQTSALNGYSNGNFELNLRVKF